MVFRLFMRDGEVRDLHNPADMPDLTLVDHIEEPRIKATIMVPDDYLGQRIVAYVVGDQVADTELIEFVAGELSNHKRPREIRFVESLPRNAMGKVQKNLLRDQHKGLFA